MEWYHFNGQKTDLPLDEMVEAAILREQMRNLYQLLGEADGLIGSGQVSVPNTTIRRF